MFHMLLLALIAGTPVTEKQALSIKEVPAFIREIDEYALAERADAKAGRPRKEIRGWSEEMRTSLIPLGRKVVPTLLKVYNDSVREERVKGELVYILGLIGDERAVPLLLAEGLKQEVFKVDIVISALAGIGTEDALKAMLQIEREADYDSTDFHTCCMAMTERWKNTAGLPFLVSVVDTSYAEPGGDNSKERHALIIAATGLRKFPDKTKKYTARIEKIVNTTKDEWLRNDMLYVLFKIDPNLIKKYPDFKPGRDPDEPIHNNVTSQ